MKRLLLLVALCVALTNCIDQTSQPTINPNKDFVKQTTDSSFTTLVSHKPETYKIDSLEQALISAGLIDIQSLNDSILVSLKYSTADNFMKRPLYSNLRKAYLQPEIAQRLARVQQFLSKEDSSLRLLIYDAVRPRSVQWKMWKGLDTLPVSKRVKFVSNPKNGSVHNYGCAVDLTLADQFGNALDMGAEYDDLRRIAYPKFEQEFLLKGLLSKEQLANRALLRRVMKQEGFSGIPTEWWHFNGHSRSRAKKRYKIIE